MRVEAHITQRVVDRTHRNDVPGVAGHHVHGEEIEIVSAIASTTAVVGEGSDIGVGVGEDAGGADLDTILWAAPADHEVETGGVAVGLGDDESALQDDRGEGLRLSEKERRAECPPFFPL